MAFDERLAERIRVVLGERSDVEERRMFGGLAFMVGGHMSCGIVGSSLMVRLDPESAERLLSEPHTRPMDFTGRPMRSFLYVDPAALKTLAGLRRWIARAVEAAERRPPKKPLRRRRVRGA